MQPIPTDEVAWSACLCVGHIREPWEKRLNRLRYRLEADARGPKEPLLDRVEIPIGKGNFWGCPAH